MNEDNESDGNLTADYFNGLYPKIPWAVSHKDQFDEMRKHNIKTPYTNLKRESTALLVIDTQNEWGSSKGSASETDIEVVVPNIIEGISTWRNSGLMIVHIVRLYHKSGVDADNARHEQMAKGLFSMAVPGTWGSQLVDGTAPSGTELDYELLLELRPQKIGENEYVIFKPHYNGFDRSCLDMFLKMHAIDGVIFSGMTFPNCIRGTQYGASDLHYRVGAIPEAMTQVSYHGLVAMQRQGVQLMSKQDFEQFAKLA
jgi:nicotinamidase-related amidase